MSYVTIDIFCAPPRRINDEEERRREGGIIETGRKIIEPIHKLIEATRSTESASDTIVTARPPKPCVTIPQPKVPHPTIVTARTPKQIAKTRVNANVSDPNHWNPRFQQGTRPK